MDFNSYLNQPKPTPAVKPGKGKKKMKTYYEINENAARLAKQSYSFSDYVPGSETEEYRRQIDAVYTAGEHVISVRPERADKVNYLCDLYAKKYAEWLNKKYRLDAFCPSMMITGGSNFPVRRKQKQNSMLSNHYSEFDRIQGIIKDIKYLEFMEVKEAKQGFDNGKTFINPFFEVVQNEEENRLQLFFDGKPTEEIRTLLKSRGYKWSGKNGCWQRQLTANARCLVEGIISQLEKGDN